MRTKKLRGLKRKTRNMVSRIEEATINFPSDFYNGYWHLHLPVAQEFISSKNTPFGIKKLCIKTLLDRAEHLIMIKPDALEKVRVVTAIDLPGLRNSQIIVFIGDTHFNGFFDRDDEFRRWIPLPKERSFESNWGIKIPEQMDVLGFKEEIADEEGDIYKGEIWFMGELK